jgi:hypothetical protein
VPKKLHDHAHVDENVTYSTVMLSRIVLNDAYRSVNRYLLTVPTSSGFVIERILKITTVQRLYF